MAEKIFNTRISLKYDTYANWELVKDTFIPKQGEVCFIEVPAETGAVQQEPAILFKVGDGSKTFAQLPYGSAKAANVYNWALAAEKPSYTATEIEGLETFIAGEIQDTDTQYTLVKVTDYQYKLQSKAKEEESYSDTGVVIDIPQYDDSTLVGRVDALETRVGTTAVATQIANAITALDLANTYEAKGAAAQALADAKSYADGKDEAIIAAKKAGDDAQASVDALETKVGEVVEGKTVVQMITDAQAAATYDDTALTERIEAVEGDVGTLENLETTAKGDLVSALNEVRNSVSDGGIAAAITIDTSTTTDGALKSYTIKQGNNAIGTIDIPKDMVVESGEVVTNPEGQVEGTYIKLVLANVTEPLYVNVGTLVDIYKAKLEATQIQISIDSSTREISATLVAGSVGTTELANNAVTTVKIADANVTLAKLSTVVQASLSKADTAVQKVETGSANGTVAVDGTDVAVKGLGSAAYTDSSAYDAFGSAQDVADNLAAYEEANDADVARTKERVTALEDRIGFDGDILVLDCGNSQIGTANEYA